MDRNLKNNLSVLFLFLLLLLVLANNPANANEYDEEYSDAYTEKPLPQGQPFDEEVPSDVEPSAYDSPGHEPASEEIYD